MIVVFRLLPVRTLVSTAKSPSSRAGINSPPKNDNVTIEITNKLITEIIIARKRTIYCIGKLVITQAFNNLYAIVIITIRRVPAFLMTIRVI